MIKNLKIVCFMVLLTLCNQVFSEENTEYSSRDDVKAYASYLATKHDFDFDELIDLLGGAVFQEKVVRIMNRQPEGTMTWSKYKNMMISESRINAGKEFISLYRNDLKRAEDIYGVPAEVIASIIGIETRYGRITGNTRVLDSLMTLSLNYPRRSKFFKTQLEEFLLLSREEGFEPKLIEGSIAGAMGYGQFMPDSYRKYAVDFDLDGVRDILNNPIDAIGSVANFLSKKGKWKPNTPIAIRAFSNSADISFKSSFKPYMTPIELTKLGLEPQEKISGNLKIVPIALELDGGFEFWLGFDNYYSLSRYNRSKLYVMAVFEFSRSLSVFL